MYRAPNCGQQDFLSELKQLLETSIKHQHSIILGDLNINLIETSITHIPEISKCYGKSLFFQRIFHPTRVTTTTASVIHNIFTIIFLQKNHSANSYRWHIRSSASVSFNGDRKDRTNEQNVQSYWIVNDTTMNNIIAFLETTDWSDIFFLCDSKISSKAYQSFINIYVKTSNNCFPIAYRNKQVFKTPLLTSAQLKSCRTKYFLYKYFLKNPSPENKPKFIT